MTRLTFKNELVKRCVSHANLTDADLILVKDHGIYIMSSGKPADMLADQSVPGSQYVCYADGFDPRNDADDSLYNRCRDAVGGDDFGDYFRLPADAITDVVLNGAELIIDLTEDQLAVSTALPADTLEAASVLDRELVKQIAEEIDEAIAAIGFRRGLQAKRKSGTYSATNFTLKIEFSTMTLSGEANTPERVNWPRFADRYGLLVTDLDRVFSDDDGDQYKIVGIKPKSYKRPILTKRLRDGAMIKFNANYVCKTLQQELN